MDLEAAMEHVIADHAERSGKFDNYQYETLNRRGPQGEILVEIQSEDELKKHEGRESTKKLEVTESPVGLIQTLKAEWSNNKNIVFVKPRNIESSGGDVTNQSPRDIIQRLG